MSYVHCTSCILVPVLISFHTHLDFTQTTQKNPVTFIRGAGGFCWSWRLFAAAWRLKNLIWKAEFCFIVRKGQILQLILQNRTKDDFVPKPTTPTYYWKLQPFPTIGNLSKTAEDEDDNVGKTIRLITQHKKRTWMSEIKLTFVPSCSRVRRQLLHFHVISKTWPIFQQLSSIFSFRKRRWKQLKFSENRNKHCNQRKYMLRKTQGLCRNIFTACRLCRRRLQLLKFPNCLLVCFTPHKTVKPTCHYLKLHC